MRKKNSNRKNERIDKQHILTQKEYGIPIIVYTIIRCLAEFSLTVLFFTNAASYFRYEIHHEEYWPIRFFILPFMYAGWAVYLAPCWFGNCLSCIESILMIVGVAVPKRMSGGKKRFAAFFSYIALIHMILNVFIAIGYYITGIFISIDETNLIADIFGLDSPARMSALIGNVTLATTASSLVINRILKVRFKREKAGSRDFSEVNCVLSTRERGSLEIPVLSNTSLVIGIVSAFCLTVIFVLVVVMGVWKRHPGLLFLGPMGILPFGGIVLSVISFIQSARKHRNDLRARSAAAIALNAYSLLPAVCMFGLVALCMLRLFFTDSPLSSRDRTLFALQDEYGEEFILVSDRYAAPKNNPDLVFPVHGSYPGDTYHKAYVSALIEDKLSEDLKEFYPDSFIYVDPEAARVYWQEEFDFRGTSLKDNLEKAEYNDFSEKYTYYCYVVIMLNKEKGTPGKYEEEYQYFSEQLLRDVEKYEMLPLTVEYLWVDSATIERAAEYLKRNPYDLSGSMDKEVWGFRYDFNHIDYEKGELGMPPQIAVNFYPPNATSKTTAKETFIRLRTLLESK